MRNKKLLGGAAALLSASLLFAGCGSRSEPAATATGGLMLSICDYDWGEHVSKIADLATQVILPNTFYLEDEPQDGTIRVTVDGEDVLTGWRYDETANAIVFPEESIPGEGTLVQAFYASGYACD